MQILQFIIKLLGVTVLLLLVETRSPAQTQTPEELYKRLQDSMVSKGGQPASYDFSWVTPQIRAELIQYIHTASSLPESDFIPPKQALLYLDDPATVEEEIYAYRKADGAGSLGGPPEAILPYLIEDLTHASSENHIPLGVSLMDASLFCCFRTIIDWPGFPPETKKWADDLSSKLQFYYRIGPDSVANRLMREWWEHNKEAVLSRQYDKATWLPPASEQVPDGPMASGPWASPQPQPTQPPSPTPAPQVQPAIDTSIPVSIYGIIVLSLAAIVGLWYFLRSKK